MAFVPRVVTGGLAPALPPGAADILPSSGHEHFAELLGYIYEGPFENPPWASALKRIREDLRAAWVAFIPRPATVNQPALMLAAGLGSAWVVRDSTYINYDEFSRDLFVNLPAGRVLSIDQFLGTDIWLRSDLYKRLSKPRGLRYALGADIVTRNDIRARLRIVRSENEGPFSETDHRCCESLIPHFERALYTHSLLDSTEIEKELFVSTVDGLCVGIATLDENGTLLRTNRVADQLLAQKNGLQLINGAIVCERPEENRKLRSALRNALSRSFSTNASMSVTVAASRRDGRPRLGMLIRSIPLGELSEGRRRPAVAIFIRDPQSGSNPSHALVSQLFGLTPMETTLAVALTNGATLNEAARMMEIRHNTARAHLRSIFGKIGVSRQTALVRVILNSVAAMGEPSGFAAAS